MTTQPISAEPGLSATHTATAASRTASTIPTPSATTQPAGVDSVTVDTIPAAPPPEVLDAIATAATAPDRLAAEGRALHFSLDAPGARVSVSVTDLSGTVLGTVPPSTALAVAAGAPLN